MSSIIFTDRTVGTITRYIASTPPLNNAETALLDILLTDDGTGFNYGDLSKHGGGPDISDNQVIADILSGTALPLTTSKRVSSLLTAIYNSPNFTIMLNNGYIINYNRRSLPFTNISLGQIATEFVQSNVNSKIRLYSGGESNVTATATGVQRSFSEFANKEYKIIKYLANTTGVGANIFATFTATELGLNNSKKLIANSYVTIGGGINKDWALWPAGTTWNGNVDLINYGKIKASRNSYAIISQDNGYLQIVNLGIITGAGGDGGAGGYGGNSIVSGSVVLGGAGGVAGTGAGERSPAKKGKSGSITSVYPVGTGGMGGNGGTAANIGISGLIGTDGKNFTTGGVIPAPIDGPWSVNSGSSISDPLPAIYGNNIKLRQSGTLLGAVNGSPSDVGGVGTLLSAAPQISSPYIIPKDSIVMVNSADPLYVEWEYYANADGRFIKGTSIQSEIGTQIAATTGDSIVFSPGYGGGHSASPAYPRTSASTSYTGGMIMGATLSAGDHYHNVSKGVMSGPAVPAKMTKTLLRATKNQTEFPPNSIHVNAAQKDSNLTRLMATASYNYYIASSSASPTLVNPTTVSVSGAFDSISSSAHNHEGSGYGTSYYIPAAGHAEASGGATYGSHSHGSVIASGYIYSIVGKLISMWLDANDGVPYADDIIMYCGDLTLLPSYWKVCDGTNGTTDMRNYFLGYSLTNGVFTTSQASIINAGSSGSSAWTHSHIDNGNGYSSYQSVVQIGHTLSSPSHSHTVSVYGSIDDVPAHIKLAFIQFKP